MFFTVTRVPSVTAILAAAVLKVIKLEKTICWMGDGMRRNISPRMKDSITMGLGYALTEEVHFKDGAVLDHNFDTYQIPRFSWLPKIETILIENLDTPASGCGEPPIITVGAVLANAIFDATGVRLRQLPMTSERLKAALLHG